jgi:hypothetical protein
MGSTFNFPLGKPTLISSKLPQRLVERLFAWKRGEPAWADFPKPSLRQLKSVKGEAFSQTIALLSALSMNPHVALSDTARDGLGRGNDLDLR